jgi:hypothetical protein
MRSRRTLILIGVNLLLAAGLTVAAATCDHHVRSLGGLQFTLTDREAGSSRPSLKETHRSIELGVFDRHPEWPQRFVAASWTGYWYFPEPLTIDLYAGADDRVTVRIDQDPMLIRSPEVGMETTMTSMRLGAGTHAIDVQFEQDGGGLGLNVLWAPSGLTPSPLASAWLFPSPPTEAERAAVDRVSHLNVLAPAVWLVSLLVWMSAVVGPWAWRRATLTLLPREPWAIAALSALVLLGVVWRILLVRGSPAPFGYVYDPYWEPVEQFYRTGVLPIAADCWQCYHPPAFTLAGLPFFAAGMWLFGHDATRALTVFNLLATLCGIVCVYYAYRLLRWFRLPSRELVLAMALALGVPFLFMSSYGAEADVFLSAIMTALLYHLARYHAQPVRASARQAVVLGILAGVAMATKYSGLVGLMVIGMICAVHLFTRDYRRAIRDGLIVVAVSLAIGSWKYVDNQQRYGTPLFANGSAADGFRTGAIERYWDRYDFTTFDMRGLLALTRPDAPDAPLTSLRVYKSVWATLHGMAWGDMGFFTNPSRGGIDNRYVWRGIPPWLSSTVLVLGLLPTALALVGVAVTFRRRALLPLLLMTATTMAAYVFWFTAQQKWALKTKYVLFLLPAYLVFAMFGLRAMRRLPLRGGYEALFWFLVVLAAACQAYLFRFAIGA